MTDWGRSQENSMFRKLIFPPQSFLAAWRFPRRYRSPTNQAAQDQLNRPHAHDLGLPNLMDSLDNPAELAP
jgi:hypothetical protein